MFWYLLKRTLRIPFVLLSISFVIFFISKHVPQDSVINILALEGKIEQSNSDEGYSKEDYLQVAKQYNYHLPNFYIGLRPAHYPKQLSLLPEERSIEEKQLQTEKRFSLPSIQWNGLDNQYHAWIKKIISGDFGISFVDGKKVSTKIAEAFRWTIVLVLLAILLSFALGISMGVFSKTTKNKKSFEVLKLTSYFLYAIPVFWFATIMLIFFTTDDYGAWTNIFPSVSILDPREDSFFPMLLSAGKILILPLLIMTLHAFGYISRQMESSLTEEVNKLYARTALSKGLSYKEMITKHGFKNALLPIITLLSSAIPGTIAGSVIIETIFNIPGLGRLIFESILVADWNVVFGVVFMVALITSISFLLSDLLYAKTNPKIRLDLQ